MKWNNDDLTKWIVNGCDNSVGNLVTVIDISNNELTILPQEIGKLINLQELYCSHNKLTKLPQEIGNLINLEIILCDNNNLIELPTSINNLFGLKDFRCHCNKLTVFPKICNLINVFLICYSNEITSLPPEIGNLTNLQIFMFTQNELTTLPSEIGNLINLTDFMCGHNKLTTLPPEIGNLINLSGILICCNQLTTLPSEIGNLTNLTKLWCNGNKLTTLPSEIGNLINLQQFKCNFNQIKTLPQEMCKLINLDFFHYNNNPIDYINPQIVRLINMNKNTQKIYNDKESVHDHNIQESIKDSIQYIMSVKPSIDNLNELIINNNILTKQTKDILIDCCNNKTIHSTLNITFNELLLNVYSLALLNPHNHEIFNIINTEMHDAKDKCFTGKISRLVNCLNGFDENIKINISHNTQISNVIISIRNKLIKENMYDLETHKQLVIENLLDKKYDMTTINKWLDYL